MQARRIVSHPVVISLSLPVTLHSRCFWRWRVADVAEQRHLTCQGHPGVLRPRPANCWAHQCRYRLWLTRAKDWFRHQGPVDWLVHSGCWCTGGGGEMIVTSRNSRCCVTSPGLWKSISGYTAFLFPPSAFYFHFSPSQQCSKQQNTPQGHMHGGDAFFHIFLYLLFYLCSSVFLFLCLCALVEQHKLAHLCTHFRPES